MKDHIEYVQRCLECGYNRAIYSKIRIDERKLKEKFGTVRPQRCSMCKKKAFIMELKHGVATKDDKLLGANKVPIIDGSDSERSPDGEV